MTQTEYQSTGASTAQTAAILSELKAHENEWVPLPQLALVSHSFNVRSRVWDLRGRGHVIINKAERDKATKQVHSFYKLVTGPTSPPDPDQTAL